MNAATRAQAAALLARLFDPARAPRPHTLARARRILEAARARDRGRLPAGRWPAMKAVELDERQPCDCPHREQTAEAQGFKVKFLH